MLKLKKLIKLTTRTDSTVYSHSMFIFWVLTLIIFIMSDAQVCFLMPRRSFPRLFFNFYVRRLLEAFHGFIAEYLKTTLWGASSIHSKTDIFCLHVVQSSFGSVTTFLGLSQKRRLEVLLQRTTLFGYHLFGTVEGGVNLVGKLEFTSFSALNTVYEGSNANMKNKGKGAETYETHTT